MWIKNFFLISSIDRVLCGSDAQIRFFTWFYKEIQAFESSTNCGCGHLMSNLLELHSATVHSL